MVTFYHYILRHIYTPDPVISEYSSFSLAVLRTEMQFARLIMSIITNDYYSRRLDDQNKTKVFSSQYRDQSLQMGGLGHPLNTHRVSSCCGVRKGDARVCSVQVKEGKRRTNRLMKRLLTRVQLFGYISNQGPLDITLNQETW